MAADNLLKVLQDAGLGSRRKLSEAIFNGRVIVNGTVVEDLRYPVVREKDEVSLDGKLVSLFSEKHTYIVLNKPEGIISAVRDDRRRKTVIDILPAKYQRMNLHPVGRLDKDSTGLLLLTNDGDLTYCLTHPKFEHEKEYLVQADGILTPKEITALQQGLELDDGKMTHLRAGDTVIQTGTRHAWRNQGSEPCRLLFCLVGARRVAGQGDRNGV